MANRIKGKKGRFKVIDSANAEQIVVDTDDFSFNESNEVDTFAVHGEDGEQAEDSVDSYEISLNGIYSTDDAGQVELAVGKTIGWAFYLDKDETGPTGSSWSGNAKISSIERSAPADDKVTFSLSATGNGSATKTNAW